MNKLSLHPRPRLKPFWFSFMQLLFSAQCVIRLAKIDVKIFVIEFSKKIPLKFAGLALSPFLYKRKVLIFDQSSGVFSMCNILLK